MSLALRARLLDHRMDTSVGLTFGFGVCVCVCLNVHLTLTQFAISVQFLVDIRLREIEEVLALGQVNVDHVQGRPLAL